MVLSFFVLLLRKPYILRMLKDTQTLINEVVVVFDLFQNSVGGWGTNRI